MYTLIRTRRLRDLEQAVERERASGFAARREAQLQHERVLDEREARRSADGLLQALMRYALDLPSSRNPATQARLDRIRASMRGAEQADGADGVREGATIPRAEGETR